MGVRCVYGGEALGGGVWGWSSGGEVCVWAGNKGVRCVCIGE